MYQKRALKLILPSDLGRKLQAMIFISGPRQVGKTRFVQNQTKAAYYNWDTMETRRAFSGDPYFFRSGAKLVAFDEMHKRRDWKQLLKGYYDSVDRTENIIVTGSGRLDLFQKGGDSLQGRYQSFHLWPLAPDELSIKLGTVPSGPRNFSRWEPDAAGPPDSDLIRLGGFPGPFFQGSDRSLRKWQDEYIDRLVREDVRDISRIELLDRLDLFVRLLPSRVGSPLSQRSMAEDCEVSPVAVKGWLRVLEILYLGFLLPPYSRRIERAVKRERKWYFLQWTMNEDAAARFENYIAVQLQNACAFLSEQGYGRYELFYLRDQDHREVDFLIARDLKPLALVEAKAAAQDWPAALKYYTVKLSIPGFLVYPEGPVRRIGQQGWSLPSRLFLKNLMCA